MTFVKPYVVIGTRTKDRWLSRRSDPTDKRTYGPPRMLRWSVTSRTATPVSHVCVCVSAFVRLFFTGRYYYIPRTSIIFQHEIAKSTGALYRDGRIQRTYFRSRWFHILREGLLSRVTKARLIRGRPNTALIYDSVLGRAEKLSKNCEQSTSPPQRQVAGKHDFRNFVTFPKAIFQNCFTLTIYARKLFLTKNVSKISIIFRFLTNEIVLFYSNFWAKRRFSFVILNMTDVTVFKR